MKKIFRWGIYLSGMVILALGITLNTKTGLGVSPIITVAYSVSTILGGSLGNIVFVWYCILVLIQMILHSIKKQGKERLHAIILDLCQIPLSVVFTRFMNVFTKRIPQLETDCIGTFAGSMAGRILFLLLAISLTGIGAAMTLDMRIIPNPGDGIVQAVSDFSGRRVGFVKNCIDVVCVTITCLIGYLGAGRVTGIGIGTLLAVLGTGRVIALFQFLFQRKLEIWCDITKNEKNIKNGLTL